jgi:two-component system sensor histidine kinase KdpD
MEPETVGQYLNDISVESDRLRRLTEDFLVLSRADDGRLVLPANPIMLEHLVRATVTSEGARSPRHRFTFEASSQLPLVAGDEAYVEQVVRNFLSNAAKYGPPDTTVRVALTSEAGGVAVRVIDEGPGLPDESSSHQLFELFYRAPDAISSASGAGIGLFVCRTLVEAMGGRIWATNAPGHGAEFGFWLPARAADQWGDN